MGALLALIAGTLVPVFVLSGATSAQTPTTPTTPTTPATPEPTLQKRTRAVSLTAKLRVRPSGGAFVGTGSVAGKPFGKGRFRSRAVITSRSPLRTASTFTATYKKGKVTFKGAGRYVGSTFRATVKVASGTRAYRGITGSKLKVSSSNRGGAERVRLTGKVRYLVRVAG